MLFHHEFWASSVTPRTHEVSFWTNIQTQGHKSARVRIFIRCGESHWLLASVLREQDRTIPLAREFWSSLENVSENLSLMLSGQRFQFTPDIQWQKLQWWSGSLPARPHLPSQSQQLCLTLISRGELGYRPLFLPAGFLEATRVRKHVLWRLYAIHEGIWLSF